MNKKRLVEWLLGGLVLFALAETAIGGSAPEVLRAGGGNAPVWGVNAIALQPISAAAPSATDLLTNDCAVSLNRFYRAGGIALPATPTECRITYNPENLFVVFRCTEDDMAFPAFRAVGRSLRAVGSALEARPEAIRRGTNWFSLLGSPAEQDSAFPDKVDLFIQPDMGSHFYYQFTATLDGLKFGCKRQGETVQTGSPREITLRANDSPVSRSISQGENDGASVRFKAIESFEATVARETNGWIVCFRIPWKTLGGRPKSDFGLLPVRTRWRDGEVSSPVAFDFTEWPPPDLFIETHLDNEKPIQASQTTLCRLPSGTLRWQRPALLSYPDAETIRQIWQMEGSLNQPTDETNLARRLGLTQSWVDLLTLEGFNFRAGTGSIVEKGMVPYVVRREINAALQHKETGKACRYLDTFLQRLNRASQDWFADGSPGDILNGEWKPVWKLNGLEARGNVLLLHCLAGDRGVDLHLSLPEAGGVRIYGNDEGYFRPANSLPMRVVQSSNACSIATADGKIIISQAPFSIAFHDTGGNPVMRIGPDDIAFRFSPAGKVIAVDFRNHLDADEVIHGFGEKYDRFNENGNVLTLWGMDDWSGNTAGLMNQSYKPIPIFHSSKGCMVFDNSTYRLRADIGRTRADQYRLTQQGPVFDYYFWIGPPEKALQSYAALTGKPILPPKWAFEPWMGRTGRGWSHTPLRDPVAEEESVVKRFEALDIPHSAIYAEGTAADSPALNKFMAARGIKVLSWSYPVISQAKQESLMPELKPDELPILQCGNEAETRELGYVDFTSPDALELCRRWWKHRLDIGVAGSMVDFGDRVPEDAVFADGRRGDEMHNFYSYDYHKTYSEVFRERRGDDFILFGRAAAPGTQKWVAQFAGDHPSNFAGLQAVLTGALNLCACGFSTWGSDLGGFLGWPEPAVYMRWTQFACFSPLMRCHGRTPREPWNYGEAAVANYKYHAWVRENLLDYIYNAAVTAHETGIPIMRSMSVACPDEPSLAAVEDQYMFGADMLVAPVITENNSRTIRFPSGQWTSLWDGKTISGPANIKVSVPLDRIPVYLKPGAVVPVQLNPALEFGASMTRGRVNALIVTLPKEAENVALLNEEGQGASVFLQPATGGFSITLKNLPEMDYLLVYDAAAVGMAVDGKTLPKLAGIPFTSMPPGWQADPTANRVVIRLPSIRTPQMEIQLHCQ